jgi:hypothetical protein
MTTDAWGQYAIEQRAQMIAAFKLPQWLEGLESHRQYEEMKNSH